MEKKTFTIYDIAEATNVSPATVSRVLNGNYPVSRKTREKVMAKIEEYNFQPNGIARSLTRKETKMIGFILPDITNPFFSRIFIEVEKYALIKGYTIFLCNSMNDSTMESLYLRVLSERQVEGIIMMGGRINKTVTVLEEAKEVLDVMSKIPVLMINGEMESVDCYKVRSDENKGIRMIVDYLVKMGHKNIGLLGGRKGVTSTDIKVQGFIQTLKAYRLVYNTNWHIYSEFSVESGEYAMRTLLQNRELPTAIICMNDMIASGALIECNNQNINPEKFSFVGYDDTFVASIVTPSLTSVNHNYKKIGKAAVDLIIDAKSKKEEKKEIVVEPFLTKRNSSHFC
ncbi:MULTISPECIES: LacI family DNA-binding transcriptional regulator [Bacillus]|uniref:LacI family DNA-binding transcriptional regulator n=1 Tax=Bacillus TaxID=1386 RepID=UPI0005343D9E|nr:LacI family DNA-binding transcriptional regulator [Bacillus pseudomycoides]MCR8860703.1 LacI family transcriptional regulator [Bacillus pseudomycoides]MED0857497.1 LacI family DNA-binding transcriptional regulator [Bacillus pseudomycoides]MED1534501.1 LacI family DNA-binding transcriptional regulator [Bacillus pseudomycoides]